MSDYSLSDIMAAVGGRDGGMFGGSWLLVILVLVFFLIGGGRGWNNGGEFGQYATAASQQEILFGQRFDAIGQKINSIGDGICSSTYALNNAITGEGRAVQMQMAEGFAGTREAISQLGNMIQQNEMARVRDDRDYWRNRCGYREETDRILYTQGSYYNNAPCEKTCSCGT